MNILDILKKIKRKPQVVLPKDIGMIVAYTGVGPGWNVLDAGTGSAWMASFLAYLVKPGKVVSYEKREEFADNAKEQVGNLGIDNLTIINKDILRAKLQGEYDLVTIDMKGASRLVKKAHNVLKSRGWIACYSPHIEQAKRVLVEMEKLEMERIQTVESIVREWKIDDYSHPLYSGLMHTGFLSFGRK